MQPVWLNRNDAQHEETQEEKHRRSPKRPTHPRLSAWKYLNSAFDYNVTSLTPLAAMKPQPTCWCAILHPGWRPIHRHWSALLHFSEAQRPCLPSKGVTSPHYCATSKGACRPIARSKSANIRRPPHLFHKWNLPTNSCFISKFWKWNTSTNQNPQRNCISRFREWTTSAVNKWYCWLCWKKVG